MKIIYVAQHNADMTEGRGPMVPIAYFLFQQDALDATKGHGVMGVGDGEVQEIVLFESLNEFKRGQNEILRRRALGKLSKLERKALGLE